MIKLKDLLIETRNKNVHGYRGYKAVLDGPLSSVERVGTDTWVAAKKEVLEYLRDHIDDYKEALRDITKLKKSTVDKDYDD
ncbi:hypothetical protein LCGC14_2473860 [marine sediment metagenome]|uniref:Uncharacterized protein n=1 Tax=marine sediment metagenome TaxID=412755 RepID=A0A0F9E3F4_9ZZZZ